MHFLGLTFLVLLSFHAASESKSNKKESIVEMTAINSPVKESTLKISIQAPEGFQPSSAKYLIKDAISLVDKSKKDTPLEITQSGSAFTASINVNHLSPGQYRLYLKIKDKKSGSEKEIKNTKRSVVKDYLNFVIDSSLEVKDPGAEGKKTLLGIDSDNDGIRDDLQRFINTRTQGEVQLAYKQYARTIQLRMMNHESKELSNFYNHRMSNSIVCIQALGDEGYLLTELQSQLANTEQRVKARLNNMRHFHGEGTSEEVANTPIEQKSIFCEF